MAEINENLYKNEGMAIFIKGHLVIGIHPDNLENNLDALVNGDMKIDWDVLRSNIESYEKGIAKN